MFCNENSHTASSKVIDAHHETILYNSVEFVTPTWFTVFFIQKILGNFDGYPSITFQLLGDSFHYSILGRARVMVGD